jgi:carbonic anhydrase
MSFLDEALTANEGYAAGFTAGDLSGVPARRAAVLTCMDSRLDPARLLGFDEGEVHVIRNAGGRASDDALRSLVISSHLLGSREYLVIHHTDCGMQGLAVGTLRTKLKDEHGADASNIDFLPFDDLDQSVKEDVHAIATSPFIPAGVSVTGLVYDVRTGRLRCVVNTVSPQP